MMTRGGIFLPPPSIRKWGMWAKWAGPEGPVGQICFGEGGQENTPSI